MAKIAALDAKTSERLGAAGAIEAIVHAMSKHKKETHVQEVRILPFSDSCYLP